MQSLVNDLVTWCTHVIAVFGLPGIFVLMLLESACIPIPAEATMLFAGFAVSQGKIGLAAAIVVGVAGNVVGAWLVYYVGLYGGGPSSTATASTSCCATSTSSSPSAGLPGTGRSPCSSAACCRGCAASSRCRPAWPACRSGGSPSTRPWARAVRRLPHLAGRQGRRQLARDRAELQVARLRGGGRLGRAHRLGRLKSPATSCGLRGRSRRVEWSSLGAYARQGSIVVPRGWGVQPLASAAPDPARPAPVRNPETGAFRCRPRRDV